MRGRMEGEPPWESEIGRGIEEAQGREEERWREGESGKGCMGGREGREGRE